MYQSIISCKPNTKITIIKHLSLKYRIAETGGFGCILKRLTPTIVKTYILFCWNASF